MSSADIAALQAEIQTLTATRNDRLAAVLKARASRSLKSTTSAAAANIPNPSLPAEVSSILISKTASLTSEMDKWNLESLYRMAGITTFGVQEPGPHGGRIIGIRIEVFVDSQFLTPHYLFLAPYPLFSPSKDASSSSPSSTLSKTHLTLHKHTLPSYFLPLLSKLCTTHLAPPPTPQYLSPLIHAVRHAITLHAERRFLLSKLKEELILQEGEGEEKGIISSWAVDEEFLSLDLEWAPQDDEDEEEEEATRKRTGSIVFTEEGEVGKVVIMDNGKRVRSMEQRIKSNGDEKCSGVQKQSWDSMGGIKALRETLVWRS